MRYSQIQKLLATKAPLSVDQERLCRTVDQTSAEQAGRKPRSKVGFLRFCLAQLGFFGWRVWLVQAGLLLAMGVVFGMACQSSALNFQSLFPFFLRVCAVATALTALPVLYRSAKYKMLEVELSAHTGYLQLLLSRLLITFVGDMLMLCGLFALAVLKAGVGPMQALFCVLPAFLLTLCILLLLLPRLPLRVLPYALGAAGCLIFIASAALGSRGLSPALYPVWTAVCLLLALAIALQFRALGRQTAFFETQLS